MTAAVIEVEGLAKRFGKHTILEDVSLAVPAGCVTAVIGPSGAGKSTLLRCLNLLTLPDHGRIQVAGHAFRFGESAAHPKDTALAALRAEVGMVFQHFNLFPHMNVLQNVMEGPLTVLRMPRAEARARAGELLERVGLAAHANAYPDRLSGGQKQRVAIARALAMRPQVMLFDEATSALDPELVGEVLAVIGRLAADGMTMLLVTHEIAFARDVADEVVFMRDARIVERGPAAELLDHPRDPRTATFLTRFHRRPTEGSNPP